MTPAQQARAEDIAWMARTGECPSRAAQRLGYTNPNGLQAWCRRHGRMDLWEALVANTYGAVA